MRKKKLIIAVTGASGSIYAQLLLEQLALLKDTLETVQVLFTDNGSAVWKYELKTKPEDVVPFPIIDNLNLFGDSASGSSKFDAMIIIPCSMGTLGRIAHGISDDLITRSADVMLKERRKLILVTRETPLNLIHIENMRTITLAGGIICPASPSFYSYPQSITQLCMTVIERVFLLLELDVAKFDWSKR